LPHSTEQCFTFISDYSELIATIYIERPITEYLNVIGLFIKPAVKPLDLSMCLCYSKSTPFLKKISIQKYTTLYNTLM